MYTQTPFKKEIIKVCAFALEDTTQLLISRT